MSYNPIERLLNNDILFLYNITTLDTTHLIEMIRENPQKDLIIQNLINANKRYYLNIFILRVAYDNPKFIDKILSILKRESNFFIMQEGEFTNFIHSSKRAYNYVIRNLDTLLQNGEEAKIKIIIEEMIEKGYSFDPLRLSLNMHYRGLFILNIINNYPDKFNEILPNFTRYLVGYNYKKNEQLTLLPELIPEEDISRIIEAFIKKFGNISLFYELKEFLLANYQSNDLAKILINNKPDEFQKDADRLFLTSRDYQIEIMKKYSNWVTKDIIDEYFKSFRVFLDDDDNYSLTSAVFYGLSKEIKRCVDTYLEMSKDKTCSKVGKGSTTKVYRIGDFVIKISSTKWSYENVICPDLFLIAKDFEDITIRDKNGVVLIALEVQQYLTKKPSKDDSMLFKNFSNELHKRGYYLNDSLFGGICGDNSMLLNSYKDANVEAKESLPKWFKEKPLVLVDRDRVYKLSNEHPKQLRSGY
jgi:hypothetical protein